MFFICSIVICLFRTWPYLCIYLCYRVLRPKEGVTIFKSLSYHTMLTTPQRYILWSNLNFSTSWSDPNFWTSLSDPTCHHHGRTPTSTVCLHGRQPNCLSTYSKVNSQLTLFQNLQILRTIASRHDIIHTPTLFPIWGLLWQLWLSYYLRTNVNCTQCYAPELRVK